MEKMAIMGCGQTTYSPSMSCVNNFEPPNTISAKTLWLHVSTFCHNFSCWAIKASPLVMGVSTCAGFQWEFALQLLVNMKQLGFLANSGRGLGSLSGSLVLIQCQDFMGISKGCMRPRRTWINVTYMKQQMQGSGIFYPFTVSHIFGSFLIHSYRTGGTTSITLLWPSDLQRWSINIHDPAVRCHRRELACLQWFVCCFGRSKEWHWVTVFTSIDHTGQFKRKWRCPHLRTRKVISSQNFWGFLESFFAGFNCWWLTSCSSW